MDTIDRIIIIEGDVSEDEADAIIEDYDSGRNNTSTYVPSPFDGLCSEL